MWCMKKWKEVLGIIVDRFQCLEVQGRVHNLTNAPRIFVKVFLLVERPPSKTVRKARREVYKQK